MTVFLALIMVVLVGFLGLAVDVGHLYLVKGQLQNAADAAALAGAGIMCQGMGDVSQVRSETLNFVAKNKSDGVSLADAEIQLGCMDSNNTFNTSCPEIKAVKVTVSRAPDNNGGPVATLFARVLSPDGSLDNFSVSAKAVAAVFNQSSTVKKPHLVQ